MTELCTPTEPRERYGRKTVEAHVKQDEVRDERESGAKWLAVYAGASRGWGLKACKLCVGAEEELADG
jgi:hypothetical protein